MNMSLLIINTKCTGKTSTDAYCSNAALTLTLERKTRSSLKVWKWTALSVYYLFMFLAFCLTSLEAQTEKTHHT